MNLLLDMCAASRALESFLIGLGHDVVSAAAIDPRADDDVLLARALAEGRALVTVDKDFGELIFVLRQPHGTIIRFVEMSVDDQKRERVRNGSWPVWPATGEAAHLPATATEKNTEEQ